MKPRAVLVHRDTAFHHQTVYLTGHVYERCTFDACTLVFRGAPSTLTDCSFTLCAWHLDFLVHDSDQWDEFLSGPAAAFITKTIPRTTD
jgi:hypothetical protein